MSIFRVSVLVLVVWFVVRLFVVFIVFILMELMNILVGSIFCGMWCVRMEELWLWNSVMWEFLISSFVCV